MVAGVFTGAIGTLFLLLGLASIFIAVWALIDAAIRPTMAFQAAGQNKVLWIMRLSRRLSQFGLPAMLKNGISALSQNSESRLRQPDFASPMFTSRFMSFNLS